MLQHILSSQYVSFHYTANLSEYMYMNVSYILTYLGFCMRLPYIKENV